VGVETPLQAAIRDRLKVVDEYAFRLERGIHLLARERAALVNALEAATSDKKREEFEMLGLDDVLDAIGVTGPKSSKDPSLAEMIVEVLTAAHLIGEAALSPKEIAMRIGARWGKRAKPSSIGPITWRLAQAGRIVGEGGMYRAMPAGPEGDDHG
jgi:hypothetical protein